MKYLNFSILKTRKWMLMLTLGVVTLLLASFTIMNITVSYPTWGQDESVTFVTPDTTEESRHSRHFAHWCSERTITFFPNNQGAIGETVSLPLNSTITELNEAANQWNNVSDTYMDISISAAVNWRYDGYDNYNVICWINNNDQIWNDIPEFRLGYVTAAAIVRVNSHGCIQEVDVLFDSQNHSWSNQPDPPSVYDVGGIAVHEFGHTIGFGHVTDSSTHTMHPSWEGLTTSLSQDEVTGKQWAYPVPFVASILGPDTITSATYCRFTAIPQDSTPHCNYLWWWRQLGDDQLGTNRIESRAPGSGTWWPRPWSTNHPSMLAGGYPPGIDVKVQITDANGDVDTHIKTIVVTEGGTNKALPKHSMDSSFQEQETANLSNYPNPFNPNTTLAFYLPEDANTELTIINSKGQKICILVDQRLPKGKYQYNWHGLDKRGFLAASGIYFARLRYNDKVLVQKMLYAK